jgi:hypothetical protein
MAEGVRLQQARQGRGSDRTLQTGDRRWAALAQYRRRATEVAVAVRALNRMLELGRPDYVRTA